MADIVLQLEFMNSLFGVSLFFLFLGSFNVEQDSLTFIEGCYNNYENIDDLVNDSECKKATVPFCLCLVAVVCLALFCV